MHWMHKTSPLLALKLSLIFLTVLVIIILIRKFKHLYCLCSLTPQFIEVQPNDGFGTLLPNETLEIDLIFSVNKAKEYSFQLSCKSGINRFTFYLCKNELSYIYMDLFVWETMDMI